MSPLPKPSRILLSPPDVGPTERQALLNAFDSGWIAPVGPELAAFEQEFAEHLGDGFHTVALSSGTAGLHLALAVAGVQRGQRVAVSSLTFVASANPIRYVGAEPVFVDAENSSWNLDPNLVERAIVEGKRAGAPITAVIAVDLYGQCARYDELETLCSAHNVTLIEDAAEGLGARYRDRPAGSFGDCAIFSFNGNKLITTSGGGMFATRNSEWAKRVRKLSTQAREQTLHYEHTELGYNYRMSNLLAAVGRAQLARVDEFVAKRRAIRTRYQQALDKTPGVRFMPEVTSGHSAFWLTCVEIDPKKSNVTRDDVIAALERANIETRPVWKPMHMQPLYRDCQRCGGEVAERLFANGLCLPSGSALTEAQQEYVCDHLQRIFLGSNQKAANIP